MGEYGFLDRVLHRAALQFSPVAELSFDLDQTISRCEPERVKSERHVFVSGLARAGTTILMRRLHATGAFCSLTYRHMPFVLAPNVWGRLAMSSARKDAPAERAHNDGILVDVDSPEALDEVFWRIFAGGEYITRTKLTPHEPRRQTTEKYVAYVAAIHKADPLGRPRYLAKNNNNILRLGTIRRAFPKAALLIPFRDPLSHAGSLLRQHGNFVAQQQSDPFVRSYMTWLGHHEFGLDHRPFRFDDGGAEPLADHQPQQLEYWLDLWCQTYAWLERSAPPDAVFVCYEELCRDVHIWKRIAELCDTEPGDGTHEGFVIREKAVDIPAQERLIEEAADIYKRLLERGRAALEP